MNILKNHSQSYSRTLWIWRLLLSSAVHRKVIYIIGRADPRRIRKLYRSSETPGGPLALKCVLILVSFWIWPAAMKTSMIIYCYMVLSRECRKVSCSRRKHESKAQRAAEESCSSAFRERDSERSETRTNAFHSFVLYHSNRPLFTSVILNCPS